MNNYTVQYIALVTISKEKSCLTDTMHLSCPMPLRELSDAIKTWDLMINTNLAL